MRPLRLFNRRAQRPAISGATEKPFTVICLYRHGGRRAPEIARSVVKGISGEEVKFGNGKWEHDTSVRHWLKKVPVRVLVRGLAPDNVGKVVTAKELGKAHLVISDVLSPDFLHGCSDDVIKAAEGLHERRAVSGGWLMTGTDEYRDAGRRVKRRIRRAMQRGEI